MFKIGLYYGCWISQQVVRTLNGGTQLLISSSGKNKATISNLLFKVEQWSSDRQAQPQYKQYSVWLKKYLSQGIPCIIGNYVDDALNDSDYDHIMPVIGINYYDPVTSYNPNDAISFYSLFELTTLQRKLNTNDLVKTRGTCGNTTSEGGCIPVNVDYGYAILGIKDSDKVTLPVSLSVDRSDEPNLSTGEKPALMAGTVTVSNLVNGHKYALLRYNSYVNVPISGKAAKFLSSKYYKRYNFQATDTTYTYVDPVKIWTNGTTYYRCVSLS